LTFLSLRTKVTVLYPFGIGGKSTAPLRGRFEIVLLDKRELKDQFRKGSSSSEVFG
jgi:hypothetical protein